MIYIWFTIHSHIIPIFKVAFILLHNHNVISHNHHNYHITNLLTLQLPLICYSLFTTLHTVAILVLRLGHLTHRAHQGYYVHGVHRAFGYTNLEYVIMSAEIVSMAMQISEVAACIHFLHSECKQPARPI